jgi:hypothetical protein
MHIYRSLILWLTYRAPYWVSRHFHIHLHQQRLYPWTQTMQIHCCGRVLLEEPL